MMVRSKCQPQIMRHVIEGGEESPLLNYGTRCPCGVHYCRITPEGKVTPCPYTPVVAGDLTTTPFRQVWESPPFLPGCAAGSWAAGAGAASTVRCAGGCRARAHALTGDLLGPRRLLRLRSGR